jgi:hypothetical protein
MALLCLIFVLGVTRAAPVIRSFAARPPDFDAAVHLLPAYQIARDVRQLDFGKLWQHTYEQDGIAYYPFMHSWMMTPIWIWHLPDLNWARISSLSYLGVGAILAFLIGHTLARKNRWLSGLINGLVLLSALILWVYASFTYLEAAGLSMILLALLFYLRAEENDRHLPWLTGSGLAATGAFLVKYSFGIFALAGLGLAEVLRLVSTRHWSWRRLAFLMAPVIILWGGWLVLPEKWGRFYSYSHSQPANVDFWSTDSWLFYLRSLWDHYAASPISQSLLILSIIYSVRNWRHHGSRSTLGYGVAGLMVLTVIVPEKHLRFGYPMLPILLLLVGPLIAQATDIASRTPQRTRVVLALLASVLLCVDARAVIHRFGYYRAALETVYTSAPDTSRAYRFVVAHTLESGMRPYIMNFWHLFSQYGVLWEYIERHGGDPADYEYRWVAAGYAPKPTPKNLQQFTTRLRRRGLDTLVSIDGSPAGSYTGWQVVKPLWDKGEIDLLADSPPYTLLDWSPEYQSRVFAGAFADLDEWQRARQAGRVEFTITLHLYVLR